MAIMTQQQFDKLAMAQVQKPIGYIGSTKGCTGMTRCHLVKDPAFYYYDIGKIDSLIPKSPKVKQWAAKVMPDMFNVACHNTSPISMGCDRYLCYYATNTDDGKDPWRNDNWYGWFVRTLKVLSQLDLDKDTWVFISDAIFYYSQGAIADSYWSVVFSYIPMEYWPAVFNNCNYDLPVGKLSEYLDKVKYLLSDVVIQECVNYRIKNMRNNTHAWIDQFIGDDTLCNAIDAGINIFTSIKDVSDTVVTYAIEHNKTDWIDLTNISISNPRKQKIPSKIEALTQLAAEVLHTETDKITIKKH